MSGEPLDGQINDKKKSSVFERSLVTRQILILNT